MFNTLFILGPTASGKSKLAIALAKFLNGVIINADSMQIYHGLENITASPSAQEKQQVPHMLYNTVSPFVPYNVHKWQQDCIPLVQSVLADGKVPILCGGTGLYARTLQQGIAIIPDIDEVTRYMVRHHQHAMDKEEFHRMLQEKDPVMANEISVNDPQRIARALEVILCTGKSLRWYQDRPHRFMPDTIKTAMVTLMPDRQVVYDTINTRFDNLMLDGGFDEVKRLYDTICLKAQESNATKSTTIESIMQDMQVSKAIGVREVLGHLHDNIPLDVAIERSKMATRRYAKRQLTFIRHQIQSHLTITDPKETGVITENIKALLLGK